MPHTTAQQPASGTSIGYGTSSAGPFTTMPQVLDLKLPIPEQDEVPLTLLAATYQTTGPTGVPKLGELGVKIRWDPADASHLTILGDVQSTSSSRWWQIAYNDVAATKEVFSGYVKNFDRGPAAVGQKLEASFTIVLTTVPTSTNNGL